MTPDGPGLVGEHVRLRPTTPDDAERLTEILAEPAVAAAWGAHDRRQVEEELLADEEVATFAVEADGQVVGLIQYHEEDDPRYRHAGLDIFLHPAWHGRGLGTDAVRTLARHLVHDRGHHRLVIDPAARNEAAVRCYARVGFRPVGVMRRYERDDDGSWHDGLLMDLLADELT